MQLRSNYSMRQVPSHTLCGSCACYRPASLTRSALHSSSSCCFWRWLRRSSSVCCFTLPCSAARSCCVFLRSSSSLGSTDWYSSSCFCSCSISCKQCSAERCKSLHRHTATGSVVRSKDRSSAGTDIQARVKIQQHMQEPTTCCKIDVSAC